jgi:hypothetical protein
MLVAGTANSQSLTEIAAKEKKRREETRSEGKAVHEFSDEEGSLGKGSAESDNDSEPDSGDSEEQDTNNDGGDPGKDAGLRKRAPEETISWKGIYGEYKVRYLHLENLMDMREREAARWCAPPPHNPNPRMWSEEQERYRKRCQEARDSQAKLRADMRELQSECLVEAKRHGVSPGDARLGN